MNKAFFLRKEDRNPAWRVIDAQGKVLGRLATEIADILRGKDKPTYTPHTDSGDYVIVINARHVVMTGKKMQQKQMWRHSGWMGGIKYFTPEQVMQKHPERLIELAVKRMLPKNILSRYLQRKLKIYPDAEHPHTAQVA